MYISRPYRGKPKDLDKRQEKERKCYEFLEKIGIDYEVVDHEEALDMDKCLEIETVLGVIRNM